MYIVATATTKITQANKIKDAKLNIILLQDRDEMINSISNYTM